jgi:hypothetical protein
MSDDKKRTSEEAAAELQAEPDNGLPLETATLYERILWIRDRVTRLGKDSTVSTGGSGSYAAISHDKVTAFIRPKMVQAGIFHYIDCVEATDFDTSAATSKGRKIIQHRGKFKITFVNALDKDDWFCLHQYAYGDDFGDKAPGKATSYAMKYALLKMFMIETGEEDEERVAPDGGEAAIIVHSEKMLADLFAVAEECFGDDAPDMLRDMSERRFYVDNYGLIPQDRFADAVRSLRVKAASLKPKPKEKDDD